MDMRAAVLRGIGDVGLETRKVPEPGPGEVLLKIEANTICGTDLRIISGAKTAGVRPGVIMGHEFAGRIAAIGEGVTGYEVGRQATCSIVLSCGRCGPCLIGREHLCENLRLIGYEIDGGLADYFLVPTEAVARGNLVMAPRELAPTLLALAEPLSCVLNGADLVATRPGDSVVVLGTGPIGLLHIALAKASGATRIIGVGRPGRLEPATKAGATDVIGLEGPEMVAEVKRLLPAGADVVIVAVGALELAEYALEIAGIASRVSYFAGFPKGSMAQMDPNLIHYKEIQVTGGSNARRSDVRRAVDLLASGSLSVDHIVSHVFPLDRFDEALAAVRDRVGLKIAVAPR